MSHWLSHLLLQAGHVAVHKLVNRLDGHKATTQRGHNCAVCGGPAPPPEGGVVFDCCGMLACFTCANRYVTPLGGGEVLVNCRCGSRRRSRLHRR
jgi:hypothetical protein